MNKEEEGMHKRVRQHKPISGTTPEYAYTVRRIPRQTCQDMNHELPPYKARMLRVQQ
jgi:hypothetical protein